MAQNNSNLPISRINSKAFSSDSAKNLCSNSKALRLTTRNIIENGEELFHSIRWKFGIVVCPHCGSLRITTKPNYHYRCMDCKSDFTDKTNTLMHNSKLPVSIWLQTVYEMVTDNFISSTVLAKKLGVNQKSAWLMMHKLRFAMGERMQTVKLSGGVIAQDEAYMGGCLTNYHYGRKIRLLRENLLMMPEDKRYTKSAIYTLNSLLKFPVFGMTDSEAVVLYSTPNPIKKEYLHIIYNRHACAGSISVSDESRLYEGWTKATGADIFTNNHHDNQYRTEEGYTSNAIENRFSWLKRGFGSRITHCNNKYHQLYLNEFCYRFNTRRLKPLERFRDSLELVVGCSVTCYEIMHYNAHKPFEEAEKKRKKHLLTEEEIREMFMENIYAYEIEQNHKIYRRSDFNLD